MNGFGAKSIRRNKGFTLVELLVVLVILALLAAVLTPAMLGYIDRARQEAEQDNAKAVLNAAGTKLVALYDQGIMPNVDEYGNTAGGDAFVWSDEWSGDVLYNSGIEVKPYICAFYTGSLSQSLDGKKGLSWLKKGYSVYALVYLEKADSIPAVYYCGSWENNDLTTVINTTEVALTESNKIYRSGLYFLKGCTGNGESAANALNELQSR